MITVLLGSRPTYFSFTILTHGEQCNGGFGNSPGRFFEEILAVFAK